MKEGGRPHLGHGGGARMRCSSAVVGYPAVVALPSTTERPRRPALQGVHLPPRSAAAEVRPVEGRFDGVTTRHPPTAGER